MWSEQWTAMHIKDIRHFCPLRASRTFRSQQNCPYKFPEGSSHSCSRTSAWVRNWVRNPCAPSSAGSTGEGGLLPVLVLCAFLQQDQPACRWRLLLPSLPALISRAAVVKALPVRETARFSKSKYRMSS